MNYLVVVAHPDDEVLGAGATIKKLTDLGHSVALCVMCKNVDARLFRPKDDDLFNDVNNSVKILGVSKLYEADFRNIRMNNVDHLELVRFIESAIVDSLPDVIITHHPADTNNDHLHTSLACQAAARLFQRRTDIKPLSELWFMECLSSTDWSVNTSTNRFMPNTYVEVGKERIETKINALKAYRGVMRSFPHPRSEEVIIGLSAKRGGESGCNYAEAFECVFRRIVKCE